MSLIFARLYNKNW